MVRRTKVPNTRDWFVIRMTCPATDHHRRRLEIEDTYDTSGERKRGLAYVNKRSEVSSLCIVEVCDRCSVV